MFYPYSSWGRLSKSAHFSESNLLVWILQPLLPGKEVCLQNPGLGLTFWHILINITWQKRFDRGQLRPEEAVDSLTALKIPCAMQISLSNPLEEERPLSWIRHLHISSLVYAFLEPREQPEPRSLRPWLKKSETSSGLKNHAASSSKAKCKQPWLWIQLVLWS